jgi:hypothetical protein
MDDAEDTASGLVRIHRELSSLREQVNSLDKHKAGAHDMSRIESEFRNADFRTLQEISGQISALRADLKEWTINSVSSSETRIMASIRAENKLSRQIPLMIAIGLGVVGVLSGNPVFSRLMGGL